MSRNHLTRRRIEERIACRLRAIVTEQAPELQGFAIFYRALVLGRLSIEDTAFS
jgi:hypothetical protein